MLVSHSTSHSPCLISVYDKTGLADLAWGLVEAGVEIVSTGSTAARIAELGVPVTPVTEVTEFPECLDGRVKTLHPHVHAGILADLRNPDHQRSSPSWDRAIRSGDRQSLSVPANRGGLSSNADGERTSDAVAEQVIEQIDIGGPSDGAGRGEEPRKRCTVVDPADYPAVIAAAAHHGFD